MKWAIAVTLFVALVCSVATLYTPHAKYDPVGGINE